MKSCPFCGETTSYEILERMDMDTGLNHFLVRCINCGAEGPSCSTRLQAIEVWNERKEHEE